MTVIDGDQIGHIVLDEPDVKKQLESRFGNAIIDPEGNVNRGELGKLVFGDSPEQKQNRFDLEKVVHPRIREIIDLQIQETRKADLDFIILDAAIMLEVGWDDLCDAVVFVETAFNDRLKRVRDTRSWSEETLQRREASQMSLDEKRKRSAAVVNNNQDIEKSGPELEKIFEQIREQKLTR